MSLDTIMVMIAVVGMFATLTVVLLWADHTTNNRPTGKT